MTGLSERVISEMEQLLRRKLSAAEVRLVLLASVIEGRLLEDETTASPRSSGKASNNRKTQRFN